MGTFIAQKINYGSEPSEEAVKCNSSIFSVSVQLGARWGRELPCGKTDRE